MTITYSIEDAPPTLAEAQKLVGGYVERVRLLNALLLCDEEGRLKEKPLNRVASMIAQQVIVGDAIMLCGAATEGWR